MYVKKGSPESRLPYKIPTLCVKLKLNLLRTIYEGDAWRSNRIQRGAWNEGFLPANEFLQADINKLV